jgi:hypothetical protein
MIKTNSFIFSLVRNNNKVEIRIASLTESLCLSYYVNCLSNITSLDPRETW